MVRKFTQGVLSKTHQLKDFITALPWCFVSSKMPNPMEVQRKK